MGYKTFGKRPSRTKKISEDFNKLNQTPSTPLEFYKQGEKREKNMLERLTDGNRTCSRCLSKNTEITIDKNCSCRCGADIHFKKRCLDCKLETHIQRKLVGKI